MFPLCRVWLAPLEILGPMGPLDRKWVTNEPLLSCFIDLSVKRCQAAVQTFGMAVRATVHKPIPHDKWDLILQVFSVISVGNEAPTSVLIRLNIAGSSVLSSVMWWAWLNADLDPLCTAQFQLNMVLRYMFPFLFMEQTCLSSSFRVNLERLDPVEQLWVTFFSEFVHLKI